MTISKKMLIFGLLAISTQFGVFAEENSADLKKMVSFAQELRKTNGVEEKKVAKWLEAIVKQDKVWLSSGELAIVATIIEGYSTTDVKVASLLKIMLEKTEKQAESDKKLTNERVAVAALAGAAAVCLAICLYSDFNRMVEWHDICLMNQMRNEISKQNSEIYLQMQKIASRGFFSRF